MSPPPEKKTNKVIKMKICKRKKPPISNSMHQSGKNSPKFEKVKTMTKNEFQIYRFCIDQINSPDKIKCKK